ncbi:hypothetical protein JVU11DRAFT_8206 [Chiua virens]|nr:hypothetical protein JVU11DRAFT_8206 [Chiua virens]
MSDTDDNDDQNNNGQILTYEDDGDHDEPFDATAVPRRLLADDAPPQQEVQQAMYGHRDGLLYDHVEAFNISRAAKMSFNQLDSLRQNNHAKRAIRVLSGRHRLEIDEEHRLDPTDPNMVVATGPHFLDFVIGRDRERGRNIELRLVDAQILQDDFLDHWDAWLEEAPDAWKRDGFLTNNSPVAITIRYGQNQEILLPNLASTERRNFHKDRDYSFIKSFTFSIATHIGFINVREWSDMSVQEIMMDNPEAYDKDDEDPSREIVDLNTYPNYDVFGDEIPVYGKGGFKIFRRRPEVADSCGSLMDLGAAHTLFEGAQEAQGTGENAVRFSVYPLAFTQYLGNIQADGLMVPFKRRMDRLDANIRQGLQELADAEDQEAELVGRIIYPVNSQAYNALSHRVRSEAKFHAVQLGLMTSVFSGTTVERAALKTLWSSRLRLCNNGLPHERFDRKVSGEDQPECMRFENTYRVDVFQLPSRRKNGRFIYDNIIAPLGKAWSHPSILSAIKNTSIVFKKEFIPKLFQSASYPLTSLLTHFWNTYKNDLKENYAIDPSVVEMVAMLERALNYAHTGSARVLTRKLMDRSWLSLSVIKDGLPSISPKFITHASLSTGLIMIELDKWPVDKATSRPLTASRRTQELTWGLDHYQNFEARFTISLAIDNIPQSSYNFVADPTLRVLCYISEIALKRFFSDVKVLVKEAVLKEISNDLTLRGPSGIAARERQTALKSWLDCDNPLSFTEDVLPQLLMAIVPLQHQKLTLPSSHLGSQSIDFFVDAIMTQCSYHGRILRPPFSKKGHFHHLASIAIKECEKIIAISDLRNEDSEQLIKESFRLASITLKINHIPWSANPDGGRGAPSVRMVHNVWLNLGAASLHSNQHSAALIARKQSRQQIAVRSSISVQLSDARGDWNALDVKLVDFHTVIHKTILPREFDMPSSNTSTSTTEAYIEETYNYVRAAYDRNKPLHHLALIASIACAGLLPHIYAPMKITQPKQNSNFTDCLRNLEWETRTKRGASQAHIFLKMVTFFIIALYDQSSPIFYKSDKSAWFKKHSSKGITVLLICRLGLAKPVQARAFRSAQWNIDVKPLSTDEIDCLYGDVLECFRKGGKHGGYDVIHVLMGTKTVQSLNLMHQAPNDAGVIWKIVQTLKL